MQFGICVMADVDEVGFFPARREPRLRLRLGHRQPDDLLRLLRRRLALAAQATNRIRLGPGTAICGTRIPPVQVAAMATLNKLAPGRVHLGIGTGNTAMRTMGQRPMRIADYDEILSVLAGLLRGEVVDYRYRDRVRPIRMLTDNKKYLGLEPKIPLYVSGFGPRAMELAGKHGDGLVFAIPPRGVAVAEALGHARTGAARAGRRLEGFRNCALTNVALLEPGEAVDRRASCARSGPTSWPASTTSTMRCRSAASIPPIPPPDVEALLRPGRADAGRASSLPDPRVPLHVPAPRRGRADRRRPDPRHLPGGEAEALVERIRDLEGQGLQELMFAIGVDEKWRVAEAFAREVIARL